MRKYINKTSVLIISTVLIFMLTTSCQEQTGSNTNSDAKKNRLIASENIQFKKDIENYQKQIKEQKKLVEQCRQEKDTEQTELLEDNSKDFQEIVQLREENQKLKEELEKLKK